MDRTPAARMLPLAVGVIGLLCGAAALAFVAISPDLRLRIVLADDPAEDGVTVVDTDGLDVWGEPDAERPRPGDVLIKLGQRTLRGPVDFYEACDPLFELSAGEFTPAQSDDPERRYRLLDDHPFVRDLSGRQYVRVRFRRPGDAADAADATPRAAYVRVQGVPVRRLWMLLAWLVPQLGLTLVGAAAFWLRPFDRSARLFFLMGMTTTVAVAGASHWWVLAHAAALLIPVAIACAFLPAVTLHFFLTYPRALPILERRGHAVRWALYLPAAVAAFCGAAGIAAATHFAPAEAAAGLAAKGRVLVLLGWFVNALLASASAGFVLTSAALWAHWRRATLRVERGQVRLLLAAAAASVPIVGFLLYLAVADRVGFVHSRGRLPALGVSLLFALAYTAGMVRYRLLRVDEVLRGGTRYLMARVGLAVAAGAAVAAAARLDRVLQIPLSPTGSALATGLAAVLTAAAAVGLADVIRRRLDRTFYREKYRLDRVLRSFGGGAAATRAAAENLVTACREVIGCDRAAVYLADGPGGELTRAAASCGSFPDRLSAADLPTVADDGQTPPVSPLTVRDVSLRSVTGAATACPLPNDDGTGVDDAPDAPPAGWVLLGPKEDRTALSAEDLTFLEAMGRTAGAALREGRARQELDRLRGEMRARDDDRESLIRRVRSLEAELAGTLSGESATTEPGDLDRGGLRGHGPAIAAVLDTARKVAGSDASVLLRGESGTGKELLAQVIHANGPRANRPLIPVHCAALSPSLLESELFGHVKGAFTGADRDRAGRFEQADGGTLFLDEIGDVPPETQVKLLRALQERTFERVGGGRPISVNVRVIAATHRNLEAMIADGEFREDLFYRLNVIPIELPPLRDRPEDLPDLAYAFLYAAAKRAGRPVTRIDEDALAVLLRHRWPGNVRELKNVIERAVVLADTNAITLADLPADLLPLRDAVVPAPPPRTAAVPPVAPRYVPPSGPATDFFENRPHRFESASFVPQADRIDAAAAEEGAEKARLVTVLDACDGNKSQAARELGLPRSTFYSKLQKHGVVP